MPSFPKSRFLSSLQFADDAALVAVGKDVDSAKNKAVVGLQAIAKYARDWRIELNHTKTEVIVFGRR